MTINLTTEYSLMLFYTYFATVDFVIVQFHTNSERFFLVFQVLQRVLNAFSEIRIFQANQYSSAQNWEVRKSEKWKQVNNNIIGWVVGRAVWRCVTSTCIFSRALDDKSSENFPNTVGCNKVYSMLAGDDNTEMERELWHKRRTRETSTYPIIIFPNVIPFHSPLLRIIW